MSCFPRLLFWVVCPAPLQPGFPTQSIWSFLKKAFPSFIPLLSGQLKCNTKHRATQLGSFHSVAAQTKAFP